ncbi:MAG TPA: hypothetical protein VHX86_08500 [Tepidisphaeraceae bacterium]|jgi:hypothetical protein|nr:hypothetical protein [Tepidisphaeraceae bacterium]
MAGQTDPNALTGLRWTARTLTWAMVAIFLLWGGSWAYRAGMDARREFWQSTRSIRFVVDIRNGFGFGNQVLRYAESEAHLEPMADALAGQSPQVLTRAGRPDLIGKKNPAVRRLTTGELLRGMVQFVDSVLQDHTDDQDYELDYPPLRLAIMTLWVRHVQRNHPEMNNYPAGRVDDTSLPQDEDIAEPMLRLNAYCAAAAAVLMFGLVWLWVKRDARANLMTATRSGWVVPHGIFAFMLATAGFWHAYVTLVHLPPMPAPVVSVDRIQTGPGKAIISVIINAQDLDTQWHIDYGPTVTYGHSLPAQSVDTTLDDQPFSAEISGLKSGQTVHFRVSAVNVGGTTNSDDFSFVNNGQSIEVDSPPVGGIVWPDWTVWLRLLVLFIAMVASAQILPPIHRAWACAAVAAMLVWLDPLNLIDSHGWPQWDVWILPVFLAATLLASVNWWTAAGILLGIGCMAKGQLLLAAPILMLWPLFEGKWGAVIRIVTGFLIGAELVTWPWIVNSAVEMHWIELTMLAAVLMLAVSLLRSQLGENLRNGVVTPLLDRGSAGAIGWEQSLPILLVLASAVIAAMAIATALIFHGLRTTNAAVSGAAMGFFLLLVLLPPWLLRRRHLGFWLASVFAFSVWIAFCAFGGSDSWLTLGFAYGSVKHDQMQMGLHYFCNLTSLLADSYHWDIHDMMGTLGFSFTTPGPLRLGRLISIPAVKWAWSSDLDVKTTMALLYGVCLVIASAAAAMQSRRKDRRFLIAMVVPWMVFPMVMCQMGSRYPIWASTISAAMVAVSMELTLLHVVLAVFGFAMVAQQLLSANSQRWPQFVQLVTPMYPDIAWMLLLLTGIFLVASLVPSRKPKIFSRGYKSDENG